jgi:2-polyprenyl-6-methoxyphenol hydroxylase-like FAD-dependent oxidoreductase
MSVTCCVAGGGPAGIVAGLLLARQGVDVLVLEKHKDFLRDFRGDTIHPSTLDLLDELGWIDEFLELPHTRMSKVTVDMAGTPVTFADFGRLRVRCPYIAFMPQWDFLNFLVGKARAHSGFNLMVNTEARDVITDDRGNIVGVRADTPQGELEIRAQMVIAADGRHSTLRQAAGMKVTRCSAPMDVLWFRLTRRPDEELTFFRPGNGFVLICINRGEHWQMAYVIPAGQHETVKAAGIEQLRTNVMNLLPEVKDRVGELRSWDDIPFLRVSVDRLRRWYRPGLLCIGDAAHAMSPAGGVGINLAVQDAVAAANILGPKLKAGQTPPVSLLRRVQRRRRFPSRVTQMIQVEALKGLYPKNLDDDLSEHMPLTFRAFVHIPLLRHITGRFIGKGIRAEHIAK